MNPIRLFAAAPLLLCALATQAEKREFTYGVAAEIDTTGNVVSADITATSVDPAFAATIENLVKQWRFHPATANGVPVTAGTVLTTQVVIDIADDKTATITARYLRHGAGAINALQVPPHYPQEAMRRRASAEVAVVATIGVDGNPSDLQLHSLMMDLDDARLGKRFTAMTIDTIKRWRFQPERVNGQAVASRVLIPVKYTIDDGGNRRWKWIVKPTDASSPGLDFESQMPVALHNATGLTLISDGSKG